LQLEKSYDAAPRRKKREAIEAEPMTADVRPKRILVIRKTNAKATLIKTFDKSNQYEQ